MCCASFGLDNNTLQDAQFTHHNRITILGSVMGQDLLEVQRSSCTDYYKRILPSSYVLKYVFNSPKCNQG